MDNSSGVAQQHSADSGPMSAAPAATPAVASDAPSALVEASQHVGPVPVSHDPQQLKQTATDVPVESSHDAVDEEGAKAVSDYISELQELQSRSNHSAAEPFGVGITEDVPFDDLVGEGQGEGEGEGESIVGSLDACPVEYCEMKKY